MEHDEKLTVSSFLANYISKFSVVVLLGVGLYFYFVFRTFDMGAICIGWPHVYYFTCFCVVFFTKSS